MAKKKTKKEDDFKEVTKNLKKSDKEMEKQPVEQIITQKMEFGTLPLTKDLMEQAKKAVLSRFKGNEEEHKNKVDRLDKYEEMYRGGDVLSDSETKAKVSPMDGFNLVEDWVALTMDGLVSIDRPFDIIGRKQNLSPSQNRVIRKVLKENWDTTDFEGGFELSVREMFKCGTLWAKTPYVVQQETRMVVKDIEEEEKSPEGISISKQTKKGLEEVIDTEDYPGFYPVDGRRLYYRAKKPSWFIELIDSNWSHVLVQAEKKLYENIEKAKKTEYPIGDRPTDKMEDKAEVNYDDMVEADGDVELMEAHHIPLQIKGKKILCIVTIINRTEVIRVQPTPYQKPPYIVHSFIPQPGSVDGIGLLQLVELLYKELTSRRRLSLDANSFGLYCMIAANMKYIKKKKQLAIRPHGLIELKEVDRPISEILQFIRPPVEYITAAENLMTKVQADIIRTSRLKGVMAGEKISPTPSATEMQSMIKEAYKSVKIIFKRLCRGVISEWLQRAYVMDILNREKSWTIQWDSKNIDPLSGKEIATQPWVEVTPQQIYTDGIDIRILGLAHMENDIVTRHQKLQKFELLAKYAEAPFMDEEGKPVKPNLYKAFMDVLRTFGEDRPEDNFLTAPPPPVPPAGAGPGGPLAKPGPAGVMPQAGRTVAPQSKTLGTSPAKGAGEGPLGGLG